MYKENFWNWFTWCYTSPCIMLNLINIYMQLLSLTSTLIYSFFLTSVIFGQYYAILLISDFNKKKKSPIIFIPYNTEQIYVGIIHCKVYKDRSSSSHYPKIVKHVIYDLCWRVLSCCQILNITCSTVCCQHAPVRCPI